MPNQPSSVIERADQLAHELHVHRVELETRNEALHRARLLGGRLEIDGPRDHVGWVGLALSVPTPGREPAGVHTGAVR